MTVSLVARAIRIIPVRYCMHNKNLDAASNTKVTYELYKCSTVKVARPKTRHKTSAMRACMLMRQIKADECWTMTRHDRIPCSTLASPRPCRVGCTCCAPTCSCTSDAAERTMTCNTQTSRHERRVRILWYLICSLMYCVLIWDALECHILGKYFSTHSCSRCTRVATLCNKNF